MKTVAQISQEYNYAQAFVACLTGSAETVMDWRCIHDQDKALQAIAFRGALGDCWAKIEALNSQGYGCFVSINQLDGNGHELKNIQTIRAQFVDLDKLSATHDLERTKTFNPAPSFCVQSSPGKFHVYWVTQPHNDRELFTKNQRKLAQSFDGDPVVFDATRIMRLPGTYHRKGEPSLVTCFSLPGYSQIVPVGVLETALSDVQVADSGSGHRFPLGDPALAAPSFESLQFALNNRDPNELDRGDWIGITAAFKQAGWLLADPDALFNIWSQWCARYHSNDEGENLKQWNSIKDTQVGWTSLHRQAYGKPFVDPVAMFGGRKYILPAGASATPLPSAPDATQAMQPQSLSGITPAISDQEWCDTSALTPTCIVENMYFADVGVRIAPGGVGKTTLALWEAIQIAITGCTLFGNTVQSSGATCFLTSEDGRGMLIQRIRKMCEAMNLTDGQKRQVMNSIRIQYVELFKLTTVSNESVIPSQGVEELISVFKPINPRMIFIDPAVSFGVGEHRVNDAEQALIMAGRIIRNAIPGCCVMYIHHSGKQNARDKTTDQYSGRGGSAFADGARMVQVMQPLTAMEWQKDTGDILEHDENGMILSRPKLSYCPPQPGIFIKRKGWLFETITVSGTTAENSMEIVFDWISGKFNSGEHPNQQSLIAVRHEIGMAEKQLRDVINLLKSKSRLVEQNVPNSADKRRKYLHPYNAQVH